MNTDQLARKEHLTDNKTWGQTNRIQNITYTDSQRTSNEASCPITSTYCAKVLLA